MSDFVNRDTLALVWSGNDPDYPDPPWMLISRDSLEIAEPIPQQYRKIVGDSVVEASQAEKDVVDAFDAETRKQQLRQQAIGILQQRGDPIVKATMAVFLEVLDELRNIKKNTPKPSREIPEVVASAIARVQAGEVD